MGEIILAHAAGRSLTDIIYRVQQAQKWDLSLNRHGFGFGSSFGASPGATLNTACHGS